MSAHIDDLFSPQRLRQNWKKPADPERGKAEGTGGTGSAENADKAGEAETLSLSHHQGTGAVAAAIMAEFELLRSLIHQQFPENRSRILDMMLDELHTLLMKAGNDTTALRQTIEEALNQIEDLMEAWDA